MMSWPMSQWWTEPVLLALLTLVVNEIVRRTLKTSLLVLFSKRLEDDEDDEVDDDGI